MEYVRYKLNKRWFDGYADYADYAAADPLKIYKGGLYFFPHFIGDDFNEILNLTTDKNKWIEEFEFISDEVFFQSTGLDKSTVSIIEDLIVTQSRDNNIIALEILKQYKYGVKAILK